MDIAEIQKALRSLGLRGVRARAKWVESECPFAGKNHEMGIDKHPSFGVRIAPNDLSFFKCQACGVRGPMYGGSNDLLWQLRSIMGLYYPELVGFLQQTNQPSLERLKSRVEASIPWSEPREVAGIQVSPQMASQVEMYADIDASQFIPEDDFKRLEGLPKEALAYLHGTDRNLTDETIDYFGYGYSSVAKRIAVPMRDSKNKLVNISGRGIHDWIKPKWLHSEGFRRDLYLYGEDRLVLSHPSRTCYLVEGMFDVAGLWQRGYLNNLGMLGAYISDFHIEKVVRWFDRAVIVRDGDTAGIKGAEANYKRLQKRMRQGVSVVDTPEGLDPDQLPIDFCRKHLGPAQREGMS